MKEIDCRLIGFRRFKKNRFVKILFNFETKFVEGFRQKYTRLHLLQDYSNKANASLCKIKAAALHDSFFKTGKGSLAVVVAQLVDRSLSSEK